MIEIDDIIDFLNRNNGRVTNTELYLAFKELVKIKKALVHTCI